MRNKQNILSNVDWPIVVLYLTLVIIGWISIYAAVYNDEHKSILDISQNYGKQLLWIIAAVVLAFAILLTDSNFFQSLAYPIYAVTLLLLAGVLVFGEEISGARSWYRFGSFALQPSEFAKFATCLAVARYLSTLNIRFADLNTKLWTGLIIGLPMAFIMLQPDAGSALVYASFILVLYREGLSGKILLFGLLSIVLFSFALIFDKYLITYVLTGLAMFLFLFTRKRKKDIITLTTFLVLAVVFVLAVNYGVENLLAEHQRDRIDVLYGKKADIHGAGYNVHQSKIAIGSGGFAGKGFLQGTQTKYDFVPEQSTDFIFCTIGEEWGFLGSILVVVLFATLLIRIVYVAERQRSKFSRIYGYGVACILFVHFFINIGMTLGLAPVIGIPLPLISYGGSSLWGFTILLFIFVKQDSYRLHVLN